MPLTPTSRGKRNREDLAPTTSHLTKTRAAISLIKTEFDGIILPISLGRFPPASYKLSANVEDKFISNARFLLSEYFDECLEKDSKKGMFFLKPFQVSQVLKVLLPRDIKKVDDLIEKWKAQLNAFKKFDAQQAFKEKALKEQEMNEKKELAECPKQFGNSAERYQLRTSIASSTTLKLGEIKANRDKASRNIALRSEALANIESISTELKKRFAGLSPNHSNLCHGKPASKQSNNTCPPKLEGNMTQQNKPGTTKNTVPSKTTSAFFKNEKNKPSLKNVPTDSNSFFYAVVDELERLGGKKQNAVQLLKLAVKELRNDPSTYQDHYKVKENESYTDYCNRMSEDCKFVESAVIDATAKILGVCIEIYQPNKEKPYKVNEKGTTDGGIVSLYLADEHYQVFLQPQQESSNTLTL